MNDSGSSQAALFQLLFECIHKLCSSCERWNSFLALCAQQQNQGTQSHLFFHFGGQGKISNKKISLVPLNEFLCTILCYCAPAQNSERNQNILLKDSTLALGRPPPYLLLFPLHTRNLAICPRGTTWRGSYISLSRLVCGMCDHFNRTFHIPAAKEILFSL